ncbi:ribosome biosynthesis protein NOC4 [Aspergillus ruber CBS 135680]|uniref:CBF-domain-containing protein n=1 Tax=Aspergillus ruber (strain CBS 135680) TaxID=1388766 RepID=A0A017S5C2_ASPRC|nr:CBF-domain-containing protein [Aspergillus ruber CBS 135680]EYE91834.1 CBF-domain-containing protein [Aspergillus ruber CBS 135680]
MPAAMHATVGSKKRKSAKDSSSSSKRRAVATDSNEDATMSKITELEIQISESRKHYNNIATLLSILDVGENAQNPNLPVAVSLCRVFSRLIAAGSLTESSRADDNEKLIVAWLKERFQEYQKALVNIMREGDASAQVTALTLSMRLVGEQVTHIPSADSYVWSSGLFKNVFEAVIEAPEGQALQAEFIEKFVKAYEDVRFHTFARISEYASTERTTQILETLITILSANDTIPDPSHSFETFLTKTSTSNKKLTSVSSHKKRAQDAWLSVLSNSLSQSQRKSLLRMMVHHIEPWFTRPELLMDFLTDSYDLGGATSLLALSGLFYLIREKNLDYPQFYTKLYSLLDADLLHSKHRSRFLRLLNTFLNSSHLPVSLVASFIKRLARLALNAPPPAIVAIIPWMYNLFKNHPTTTFMMHRAIHDAEFKAELDAEGMDDPFDPDEPDPTRTDAVESSVWEVVTLQTHYHPNVAAIAQIISQQFTKQAYNMEDFLDYTYQGMLQGELGTEDRPFRRVPVVEYHIPKRIFTDRGLEEDGGVDTAPGSLMRNLWDFT